MVSSSSPPYSKLHETDVLLYCLTFPNFLCQPSSNLKLHSVSKTSVSDENIPFINLQCVNVGSPGPISTSPQSPSSLPVLKVN